MYSYHHLKLYPEDESGPMSTKKPVVIESYNEIVFPEPSEAFLARVQNHPAVIMPRLPAGCTLPPPGIFSIHMLVFLLGTVLGLINMLSCFMQFRLKKKARKKEEILKIIP